MDLISNFSGSDSMAALFNLFPSLIEKSIGFSRLTSAGAQENLIALFKFKQLLDPSPAAESIT